MWSIPRWCSVTRWEALRKSKTRLVVFLGSGRNKGFMHWRRGLGITIVLGAFLVERHLCSIWPDLRLKVHWVGGLCWVKEILRAIFTVSGFRAFGSPGIGFLHGNCLELGGHATCNSPHHLGFGQELTPKSRLVSSGPADKFWSDFHNVGAVSNPHKRAMLAQHNARPNPSAAHDGLGFLPASSPAPEVNLFPLLKRMGPRT
jgi:hypothetical protein